MSAHEHDAPADDRVRAPRRDPLGLAQLLGDAAACVPLSDFDGGALAPPGHACGGCRTPCPSDFVPLADLVLPCHLRSRP